MSKKQRRLPAVATPPVFALPGKPKPKAEPKAQAPVIAVEMNFTARQLLSGPGSELPEDAPPVERIKHNALKDLSRLFRELCGTFGVEVNKRQARKARQGQGVWATPNALTTKLAKKAA